MSWVGGLGVCRFLPLLILCCALDLAIPVAPLPGGVEFEDDEEVVHLGGWRLTRADALRPSAPPEGALETLEARQPSPATVRGGPSRHRRDERLRSLRTALSESSSPPGSPDDH